MKARNILYTFAFAALLSSCVEDEGSYDLRPINEIKIEGIEESYSKISLTENLTIQPKVELSMEGVDESDLEYQWFFTSSDPINKKHLIIGTEKNLDYKVDVAPGSYNLNFQIYDKTTGLKWEKETVLEAISPMVRGFYLFGDKEDGTCGIDFVSMMEKRDTLLIEDIFTNSTKLKGAKDLVFTGKDWKPDNIRLYAVTESGTHALQFSSSITPLDVDEDITPDKLFFPSIKVTEPVNIVNVAPGTFGSGNQGLNNRSRITITENEMYATSLYGAEAYGNPINRYTPNSKELFKPFPNLFYKRNSTYVSSVYAYDLTNHRFVGFNGYNYGAATNARELPEDSQSFSFDQTKYTPVRDLIYLENGRGNSGRSYALMKDANNDFYVYRFVADRTINKKLANDIDKSVAIDFDKASHYTFFSVQPIILYSVGSQLWGYDYQRNDAKMIQDFGAEITYLSMDEHSGDEPTDFIIATYNNTEKGMVRKYTLKDDQNKIEVTPHEKEVWKTNLKVAKIEYRNCPL